MSETMSRQSPPETEQSLADELFGPDPAGQGGEAPPRPGGASAHGRHAAAAGNSVVAAHAHQGRHARAPGGLGRLRRR